MALALSRAVAQLKKQVEDEIDDEYVSFLW